MNTRDPLQCACADPDKCSCPNSKWFNRPSSSQSQHPHHPSVPSPLSNATTSFLQSGHNPGNALQTLPSSSSYPAPVSYVPAGYRSESSSLQWQHPLHVPIQMASQWPYYQPSASQHATNCFPQPTLVSAVSYGPLADTTAATVNAPASKKRAASGGRPSLGNKKARTSTTASTVSITTSAPAVTASVVGVGPVFPAIDTAPTPQSSVVSSTPQPDTAANPTYEAIEKVLEGAKRKKANRSDRALDVWYFVVPVETAEMDAKGLEIMKKVQDTSHEVPLIDSKPRSPFVACRFCMKR